MKRETCLQAVDGVALVLCAHMSEGSEGRDARGRVR